MSEEYEKQVEFVARYMAREDGKQFDALPNISTLWLADKMRYRARAKAAVSACNLWRAFDNYQEIHAEPMENV